MRKYILRRLFLLVPVFFGITLITFIIIHIAPGSPTDTIAQAGPRVSSEARERLSKVYGLDKPLHIQYLSWFKRFIMFDFGYSFKDDTPVTQKILQRLPATLMLEGLSLLLIFLVAIPIGILSAVKQNSFFDKITTVIVFVGVSMPSFWLALLLIISFGVKLNWLPISGMRSLESAYLPFWQAVFDYAKHLVMPVFVSAFGGFASLSRYMRAGMLETIRQDYIRTARAKGLPENKIIYKHALKNALLPVITIVGLSLPALIGGSFIIETIFAWPGMGRLGYLAIMERDYPVIMGVGAIAAILTLGGNLIADVLYAFVDPRIRYK